MLSLTRLLCSWEYPGSKVPCFSPRFSSLPAHRRRVIRKRHRNLDGHEQRATRASGGGAVFAGVQGAGLSRRGLSSGGGGGGGRRRFRSCAGSRATPSATGASSPAAMAAATNLVAAAAMRAGGRRRGAAARCAGACVHLRMPARIPTAGPAARRRFRRRARRAGGEAAPATRLGRRPESCPASLTRKSGGLTGKFDGVPRLPTVSVALHCRDCSHTRAGGSATVAEGQDLVWASSAAEVNYR